jgi:7-keto-8-aminopelargonate synthetase-like enzyme
LNREHDVLLYLDDAHGFGVIGERAADEVTELLAALDRLVDVVPLRAA